MFGCAVPYARGMSSLVSSRSSLVRPPYRCDRGHERQIAPRRSVSVSINCCKPKFYMPTGLIELAQVYRRERVLRAYHMEGFDEN